MKHTDFSMSLFISDPAAMKQFFKACSFFVRTNRKKTTNLFSEYLIKSKKKLTMKNSICTSDACVQELVQKHCIVI
jgi:hypothetical protein